MIKHATVRRSFTPLFFFAVACLFLFIFFIDFSSAEQQSLGYVKTNHCINLKQSFANSTFQNVTAITLPDKLSLVIVNKNMQSLGGGLYNYTFCGNNQIGQYIVDGVGDVNGVRQTWVYDYYATPLGLPNTLVFYLIFILVIVLIFVAGFYLTNNWIMTLGSFLVLILGFFVIINGIDTIKSQSITWPIGLVIWALGIYFLYLSVEEQLKEWR